MFSSEFSRSCLLNLTNQAFKVAELKLVSVLACTLYFWFVCWEFSCKQKTVAQFDARCDCVFLHEDHPQISLEKGITVQVVFGLDGIDRSNVTGNHVLSEKVCAVFFSVFL